MRAPRIVASQLSSLLLLSTLTSTHPSDLSPFILALPEPESPLRSRNDTLSASDAAEDNNSFDLVRRQNCPSNYNSCAATIAAPGACCSTDSVCTLDNAGNAACCPIGSFCTGSITVLAASPTPAAVPPNLVTTSTASNGAIIIISNPSTTTAAVATGPVTTTTPATAASLTLVPNSFFPYPYIPTSFTNSAACAAAYAGCTSNFAQCTADLQGGGAAGFGVTIAVPGGGGVTVAPAVSTSLSPASATSICQSLSVQACPGSAATCAAYGGAGASSVAGSGGVATTTVVVGSGAIVWGKSLWVVGVTLGVLAGDLL